MGKDFILSLGRWPQSLLLQICRPVHQQDKTLGVVAETVDHELLPVRGHVVGGRRRYGGYRRAPEQRVRRPHYHAIALLLDFRGHDLVGLREVEDFLAVPSPPRATATAGRNLPSAASAGAGRPGPGGQDTAGPERHHVNFASAGFLGSVSHPPAVGRELTISGSCPSLHEGTGPVVASHGKDPDIEGLFSGGLARIKNEAAGARKDYRPNTPIGVRQQQKPPTGRRERTHRHRLLPEPARRDGTCGRQPWEGPR